jgi:hypothetical protein
MCDGWVRAFRCYCVQGLWGFSAFQFLIKEHQLLYEHVDLAECHVFLWSQESGSKSAM